MSVKSVRIGGLTSAQYRALMSPVRQSSSSSGKIKGKKVGPLTYAARIVGNFITRLFYAVFVTHQWESDQKLAGRLWKDLTSEKTPKDAKHLDKISSVFTSLKKRLDPESETVKLVKNRLEFLQGHHSGKIDFLAAKLNEKTDRKAQRNHFREEILKMVVQGRLSQSDISMVLWKVNSSKERAYLSSNLEIITTLGFDHPFLEDSLNMAHFIYTLNTDNTRFRETVRHAALQGVLENASQKMLTNKQFQRVISAMTDSKDKEYLLEHYKKPSLGLEKGTLSPTLKSYKDQLSGSNPASEVLEWVYGLNAGIQVDKSEAMFLKQLSELANPIWQDEVISLLLNAQQQREIRVKVGLLKEGDLVCRFSQGMIAEIAPESGLTNEDGKNACASICAEAILNHLQNKKGVESEVELFQIIQKGVQAHKDFGYVPNPVEFSELIKKMNQDKGPQDKMLAAYAPKPPESTRILNSVAQLRYESPLEYPFQGVVKEGFKDPIVALKQVSDAEKKQLYGVITCGAETVFFYYNEDNTLQLFDSHGKNYLGIPKGASIRKFENSQALNSYLQSIYPADSYYTILFVGVE